MVWLISYNVLLNYNSVLVNIPFQTDEQLFVLVTVDNYKCIIGSCYILPFGHSSVYDHHAETIDWVLSKYGRNVSYIIAGEYNLPNVSFIKNETGLVVNGNFSTQSNIIHDIFSVNNSYQ